VAPGHAESGPQANSRVRDFSAKKAGFAHRRLRFSCLGPRILTGKDSGHDKDQGCHARHVLVLAQMANPCKGDRLVIDYLLNVLRAGQETYCDEWYDSPFAVSYFFSHVLSNYAPEAADLIVQRLATNAPENALETAHSMSALISCKQRPSEAWVTQLAARCAAHETGVRRR